jgi:hypothetical protein
MEGGVGHFRRFIPVVHTLLGVELLPVGYASVPRTLNAGEGQTAPRHPTDQAALAAYIAALSSDLAAMARRGRLDTLGYLLEMARLEAEDNIQKGRDA